MKKPLILLEEIIPRWSQLKEIQQVKIVRTMYIWLFIVPILARALAKLEDVVNFEILGHTFALQTGPYPAQPFAGSHEIAFSPLTFLIYSSKIYSTRF